jgi:predicted peroxiredoxin
MSRILVHITHGQEHPTRAALGFLFARTAIEQGHEVTLFLAGDAVQLLRDAILDSLHGIGTGRLREHYEALRQAGCMFYLSKGSSDAREITELTLPGKRVERVSAGKLVELVMQSDRAIVY